MKRCCDGSTYVLPNGADRRTPVLSRDTRGRLNAATVTDRQSPSEASWAVLCDGCDAVLAVVDGPREEVYSDL